MTMKIQTAHLPATEPASTGQEGVPAVAVGMESAPPPTATHPHHYICASPDGPTSKGVCKFCGAERTFSNSEPELTLTDIKRKGKRGGAVTPAQMAEFYGPTEPTSIGRWIA